MTKFHRTLEKACALCALWVFATGVLLASFGAPAARADEIYTFVVKKQEDKEANRWSLSQWLETRDKMRLMDLWLAIHSPSPYEFFIDGAYSAYSSTPGVNASTWSGTVAAFATIFGLEVGYNSNSAIPNVLSGLFDLRIFGYHDQGTNLTLQGGLRSTSEQGSDYRNGLAGARATIYLARHFGIQGLYRHTFGSTPSVDGYGISGNRYEAGAFIDFSFLRIYGLYFTEPQAVQTALGGYAESTSGVQFGTRLYF